MTEMSAPAGSTALDAAPPIARTLDRWIYVIMAAWFILAVLTGFVPDSLEKMAAVEAGQRPPFPLVMHAHAVLMGSFLLVLLAQATLVATGRQAFHQKLGLAAVVLGASLIVVGFILVPTMYQSLAGMLQVAPPEAQADIRAGLRGFDNIMLIQLRVGFLFAVLFTIAVLARRRDSGLHKRMMFLAVSMALAAAFDRISWLPTSMPQSPLTTDLYPILAVAPMFIWDVVRTRTVHKAYLIWLALVVPTSIAVHALWDSPWWHTIAPRIGGM